jgi:hypothetical protein
MTDLRYFFSGDPSQSVLQVMINGPMHQNLAGNDEKEIVEAWILEGAPSEAYEETVAAIFEARCIRCHGPGGEKADSPLTTYEEVQRYATATDTGVEYAQLARISERSIFVMTCLTALLCALFYLTRYRGGWKQVLIILPFAAMLVNVLSWWSAKQSPVFLHVIVASALVAALSAVLIVVMTFVDVWILPESEEYED